MTVSSQVPGLLYSLFFCCLTAASRRIIIKGTTEQIALARSLIEEKITEDIEMREKIQESLEKRSPRKRTGPQYLMLADAIEVSDTLLGRSRDICNCV
jgi:hypothetical protein